MFIYCGLPQRPTLFQLIINQLYKHRSNHWLLCVTYRLISICPGFFSERGVFLRAQHQHPTAALRRKAPQHVFPVAFPLCILARLVPTEKKVHLGSGSSSRAGAFPHVSPLLTVRKKKRTQFSSPCLYFLFLSRFSRCVLVACVSERKLSSLPPPTLLV